MDETRRGGAAAVAEKRRDASAGTDKGIEVAVAVDVGEGGTGSGADIDQAEVTRLADKARRGGAAAVAEKQRDAIEGTDKGIEVAVAVDVGQGGAGQGADIGQAEGVGD